MLGPMSAAEILSAPGLFGFAISGDCLPCFSMELRLSGLPFDQDMSRFFDGRQPSMNLTPKDLVIFLLFWPVFIFLGLPTALYVISRYWRFYNSDDFEEERIKHKTLFRYRMSTIRPFYPWWLLVIQCFWFLAMTRGLKMTLGFEPTDLLLRD